jgi:hypothetical protein
LLNIPDLAGRTKGPSLKSQAQTATGKAYRAKRYRPRTAADVESAVPRAQREVSTSVGEIKRTEAATKGHLGKFVGRGTKPPPKKVAKAPVKRKKTVAKKEVKKSWLDKLIEGTVKLSAEATADARKYEERKAGKKEDVRKVQKGLAKLPPKPPKRRR